MKMCLSHLHILKLFHLSTINYSLEQELGESVLNPRWMPKLLYYVEIPTFSFSLALNSDMQSRAVSTEADWMALSQAYNAPRRTSLKKVKSLAARYLLHLKQSLEHLRCNHRKQKRLWESLSFITEQFQRKRGRRIIHGDLPIPCLQG